jgi:hypothetical protein
MVPASRLNTPPPPPPPGEDILTNIGFDDKGTIESNCGILFGLTGGFLFAAYVMLWVNVRKLVAS